MANSKGNILVASYSRDGSVEALAKAVAEGVREAGAEAGLSRVPDIVPPAVMAHVPGWDRSKRMLAEYGAPTQADTEWADGIMFGTPTRFRNTSAELKAFIDGLGSLWFQDKLNGKAAGPLRRREDRTAGMRRRSSLFTSRWRIWVHHRTERLHAPKLFQGYGTPYGSSSVSGLNSAPTADELEVTNH